MPQMSPMNWILLFNLLVILLMTCIIMINFMTIKKKQKMPIKKMMMKNHPNKW